MLNSVSRPGIALRALCWSPDNRKLAVFGSAIELWDPLGSMPEKIFSVESWADDLAWSPDGRKIAAGSHWAVAVLDLEAGLNARIPTEHPGTLGSFAWSPDSKQLAVVSGTWSNEAVEFWDVEPLRLARKMPAVRARPPKCDSDQCWVPGVYRSRLAWSPDGQVLALDSAYTGLSFWDPARVTRRKRFADGWKYWRAWSANSRRHDPPDWPVEIAGTGDEVIFSPDRTKILAQSNGGHAGIWDLASGKELVAFNRPLNLTYDGDYVSTAWSPDGRLLAHMSGGEVQLLRTADSSLERSFRLPVFRPGFNYHVVHWSPDARQILAIGHKSALISADDGSASWLPDVGAAFWSPSGKLALCPTARAGNFLESPDRRYALLRDGAPPGDLVIWDLAQNRAVPGMKFQGLLISADWSPDSRQLARISSSSRRAEVEIWDIASARIVKRWVADGAARLRYLGWGEKLMALDCFGGAVRVWREP